MTMTDVVLRSWEFSPGVVVPIALCAIIYLRGWLQLHRRVPDHFGFAQVIAFFAGLITLVCAFCSPIHAFAGWLLTVHMVQHLLLMMVAPPLILCGAPYLPLLSGLPRYIAIKGVGPLLSFSTLRNVAHFISHPVFCWSVFISATLTWHVPAFYELALRSTLWHEVEHVSFLSTALLFWWPIIQPYPWVTRTPRWMILPYLVLADFQNTALSAFLIFYERVVYPTYAIIPRITDLTPLADQAAAGAMMWVAGSIFFLVPLGLITIELMSTRRVSRKRTRRASRVAGLLPSAAQRSVELH